MRQRFFKQIMTAGSSLNALSDELSNADLVGVSDLTYYIVFGAGTNAGALQPESAHVSGYTGTWAAEGSPVSWAAASRVHKVSISGASFVARVRISTGVTGGTVDVWALGQGE